MSRASQQNNSGRTPSPPTCACGKNLNIWQNDWNHEKGCPMTPVGDEKAEGLIPKYSVIRTNGNLWKHTECRYFVLDPQHDLVARRALAYYANDAREEGYTALADDLEAWVRSLWGASVVSPSGDYPQDGSDEYRG